MVVINLLHTFLHAVAVPQLLQLALIRCKAVMPFWSLHQMHGFLYDILRAVCKLIRVATSHHTS